MAHCYQLTLKGSSAPSTLASVDEALCKHLGIEVHPTNWCMNWGNIEALGFAMGYDMDKIRSIDPSGPREELRAYLESNYDVVSWRQ